MATEQETIEYFETFKLDQELMKKFLNVKREGKNITIHRYASSSIKGDNDLFIAIQESIEQALHSGTCSGNISSTRLLRFVRVYPDTCDPDSFSSFG